LAGSPADFNGDGICQFKMSGFQTEPLRNGQWISACGGQCFNKMPDITCMMKEMPYITEHLSSLRQEITTLRDLNARYSEKSEHSPTDQSALELRTNRLLEIKKELSKILNRPDDSAVWWEKFRAPGRSA
jgi:hypothetical protein